MNPSSTHLIFKFLLVGLIILPIVYIPMLFLTFDNNSSAFFSTFGATIISILLFLFSLKLEIILALLISKFLFITIIPPNADCGSASIALFKDSSGAFPKAIPHGVLCFMTTEQGSLKILTDSIPAFISVIFINDKSLPHSFFKFSKTEVLDERYNAAF